MQQSTDHSAGSPGAGVVPRRASREVVVGGVRIGAGAPVSVQTMTNTDTHDVAATLAQIRRAASCGADLVRLSCPDREATRALEQIVRESPVPLIADIHFHYRRALEAAEAGAACLRINPGNIGSRQRVAEVVRAARDHGIAIRIGVNAGSLGRDLLARYGAPCPEAMVESATDQARLLEEHGFHNFKVSLKASCPLMTCRACELYAGQRADALHLGITEAGGLRSGTVRSAIGLSRLLMQGIGDTLRVSLAAPPEEEVRVGYDILRALGLRRRGVRVIACPSCARQQFDVLETVRALESRLEHITTPLTVSVIGCVVNGPGEARNADVAITGGGQGTHQLYISGLPASRLQDDSVVDRLVALVEERVADMEAAAADGMMAAGREGAG